MLKIEEYQWNIDCLMGPFLHISTILCVGIFELNRQDITDQNTRQTIVSLVYSEWIFFESRARNLLQAFQSPVLNQESMDSLKSSIDQIKKIVEALRIDQQYIENENADRFH